MTPAGVLTEEQDLVSRVPRVLRAMLAASDRTPEEVAEDEKVGWPKTFDSLMFRGVKGIRAEKGRLVCTVPVTEQMLNAFGTLHGGVMATMIDVFSSAALWTVAGMPGGVSVDLSIACMATAKAGEDVEVEGLVLRSGRSLAVATAKIRRKRDGVLLAEGRHTKYMASNQSKL